MSNSLGLLQKIVQEAASAASPEKQMTYIVSAVRSAMQVSVCSLYIANRENGPALGAINEQLKLKINVLLGVMESDEADRRAILYPRADKIYGLYVDKLINLSI